MPPAESSVPLPEGGQAAEERMETTADELPLTEATAASSPETTEITSEGEPNQEQPVEDSPPAEASDTPSGRPSREPEPPRQRLERPEPPRRERPRPRVTVREVQQRVDAIRRVLAGVLDDLNRVAEMVAQLEDQGDDMTEELTHLNEVIKSLKR